MFHRPSGGARRRGSTTRGGYRYRYDLLTLPGAVFTRSSSAFRQTGAMTNGSSAFLQLVGNDIPRFEDRGDGLGPLLLLEGSRTNALTYSEDFSQAFWGVFGTATRTGSQADPLAGTAAHRIQAPSGANGLAELNTANVSTFVACSAYVRSPSSPSAPNLNVQRATTGRLAVSTVAPLAYQRIVIAGSLGTNEACAFVPVDGRDWSSIGGVVAGARDAIVFGAQRENGVRFPSSYIRSSGSASTRSADVLTAVDMPSRVRSGRWTIPIVAPSFASSDLALEDWQTLFGLENTATSEIVIYNRTGIGIIVACYVAGVQKARSQAITFSRDQALSIVVDCKGGLITVSGATSGNGAGPAGTPWSWSSGAGRVGARVGGANPFFGRISPFIMAS